MFNWQQTSLFSEKTQKQILSLMFAVCLIAFLGNYFHSNFAVLGKPAELYNQFFGTGSDASGATNEFLQHPTEYILGGIGEVTSEQIDTITGMLKEAHPDKADEIDMWKNRMLVFVGGYAIGDGLSGSGKKTGTSGSKVAGSTVDDVVKNVGKTNPADMVKITDLKLQKKYKHADIFGIEGNYNKVNAEKFKQAIVDHLNDPNTVSVKVKYHEKVVTEYYNPQTNISVKVDANGDFISGWKPTAGQQQYIEDMIAQGGIHE